MGVPERPLRSPSSRRSVRFRSIRTANAARSARYAAWRGAWRPTPACATTLGGPVRAELEKPRFRFETAGGPCLPDFLLTVTRPGGRGHMPGQSGPRRADGRCDPGGVLRYVIEVMGFDDPEYESGKADMHGRMRTLGRRLFRMEAPQFDSRDNPLRHQRESIGVEIRNDIMRRWRRK